MDNRTITPRDYWRARANGAKKSLKSALKRQQPLEIVECFTNVLRNAEREARNASKRGAIRYGNQKGQGPLMRRGDDVVKRVCVF